MLLVLDRSRADRDIAEDVIQRKFRIDDDYGDLPAEKFLDRLCDSFGADRKNDGAGDIFFGQAADAFYLRLGVGRAEFVILRRLLVKNLNAKKFLRPNILLRSNFIISLID